MATPAAHPACRAVDVVAAATAARWGGREVTAELVIGALAKPKPIPISR